MWCLVRQGAHVPGSGHLLDMDVSIGEHIAIGHLEDRIELLVGHPAVMAEVEVQPIGSDEGTLLTHMVAQHLP